MNKLCADKIVTEFMEKIFGFALTKTYDTDKAAELASRITFDVYTSLLKVGNVENIDGYIYRIAHNVYARYVDEEVRGRQISLDNVRIPVAHDFTLAVEKEEAYRHLRRRISYLGKIQREIVVMYYFDRLKQGEIAKRLNLASGTVKWHLHEAKGQLKGGFQKMNTSTNLEIKPVRFNAGMWSSGNPMPGKGTDFYLNKLIAQNIAYAAYWQPRTITEIAEALGVPAAFVEDEIAYLEEHGFLDKLPGGKYQTNIYIMQLKKEFMERKHELFKRYAKLVCEQYIPLVFEAMKDYRTKGIYTPKNDVNFLMWAAISYACKHKFVFKPSQYDSKYRIKRKDGGDYIAGAVITNNDEMKSLSFDQNVYHAPNNMTRWGEDPVASWQLTTYYDTRSNDYEDNRYEDYLWLYEYITGVITKEEAHADKFKRLFDKGYLVAESSGEYVNMVVNLFATNKPYGGIEELLPSPPDTLMQASEELDKALFALEKENYPLHMQELCRLWNSNSFSEQNFVTYVLAELIADGTLKPLTDAQKTSVNTIMFSAVLP